MNTIYCLVPKGYWEEWKGRDHYLPRDYEQEGFIHATKGDDLLEKVANRVYAAYEGELFVLVVDEDRTSSPVKYEQAKDGLLYPHIYGPLNQEAIVDMRRMERKEGHWAIGPSIR
ncbi:DUF952 domain-containing protein [Brevibacillus brevis]|uniref:DUF952 domain-containing protein n=1 Tax=Brevibacillus brevis TaxID=1393 RepID=A0ABY9SZS2_BREBE|nr:DUF952 domain-containing protein [Brevibacillus brevis]WNC12237.1 DUF952 domain-containing protein [Brevibacillus brevis]